MQKRDFPTNKVQKSQSLRHNNWLYLNIALNYSNLHKLCNKTRNPANSHYILITKHLHKQQTLSAKKLFTDIHTYMRSFARNIDARNL